MRFIKPIFLLVIICCSCKKDNETENKYIKVSTNKFSISINSDWKEIELNGIDSYVGGFITKNKDTVYFDYGLYSSKIDDQLMVKHQDEKKILDSLNFDTEYISFSETPALDQNQGVFHKEYFFYDTIDGKHCKVKAPKLIGDGTTKIYFYETNEPKMKLSLYAKNLDTLEQFQLLKAFRTIKFGDTNN